jgi:hypothetical protein
LGCKNRGIPDCFEWRRLLGLGERTIKQKGKTKGTNKNMKRLIPATMLSAIALLLWGCAATPHRQSAGEYIDSASITTRVKAALLNDPEVRGTDIGVDTFRGVVQLNGFVEEPYQAEKAEEIAWGVGGVRRVQNNLTIKPPPRMGAPQVDTVPEGPIEAEGYPERRERDLRDPAPEFRDPEPLEPRPFPQRTSPPPPAPAPPPEP